MQRELNASNDLELDASIDVNTESSSIEVLVSTDLDIGNTSKDFETDASMDRETGNTSIEEGASIEIQPELNASKDFETDASMERETVNTSIEKGASLEIQQEFASRVFETGNTSIENYDEYDRMVEALTIILEKPESPFSFRCRIKRVPDHLRKVNENAYTPMIISIGPFHDSNINLKSMEKFKARYLKSFMSRAGIKFESLVSTIMELKERICSCYSEDSEVLNGMGTDKFLKIILVDAIFILELFYRNVTGWKFDDRLIEDKMVFIMYDLVLLENQLPFFVLEELFALSNSSSLIDQTVKFFELFNVQKFDPIEDFLKVEHFTDLIRIFMSKQPGGEPQGVKERKYDSEVVTLKYSATQLHQAGVNFQVGSSKCVLDIAFDCKTGVLTMPLLELYDQTEALIRNVMAFEQCCFEEKTFIRDYFLFLDRLVNTTRDVDFLCDKGIICNYLGDNDAATSLVNKLNIHVFWSGVHPTHNRIFKDLNDFYEKPWHKWRAILRRQYFSTPWRIASSIAAIILLVFTFIQTVCSIIQIVPLV